MICRSIAKLWNRLAPDNDPHAGRARAGERHRRASLGSHPPGVGLPWYGPSRFHSCFRGPLTAGCLGIDRCPEDAASRGQGEREDGPRR